jgi:hypothetical protein
MNDFTFWDEQWREHTEQTSQQGGGTLSPTGSTKMTQKSHGDDSKFNRNKLKREDLKGPHYIPSL